MSHDAAPVTRDDITLAYLTRKLDIKERELTIRERELAVESARLALDREKYEWVKQRQADQSHHLDGLREMIERAVEHADDEDDGIVSRNRGRA